MTRIIDPPNRGHACFHWSWAELGNRRHSCTRQSTAIVWFDAGPLGMLPAPACGIHAQPYLADPTFDPPILTAIAPTVS